MSLVFQEGVLSDIACVTMGQSPKKEFVSPTREGLPLLNGPTEFGSSHPTPVQWSTSYSKTAEPGDILFCVRGSTTGRMNWADQQYAIGRGIASISAINPQERHFMRGAIELALPELLAAATGSTFPNVSRLQLSELPVALPSAVVRAKISGLLGALGNKIESNQRIIDYLTNLLENYSLTWGVDLPIVHLSELTSAARSTVNPVKLGSSTVDHYSLPAFDDTQLPERGPASLIKSSKLLIDRNSVLVSRLNPRIDRSWWVEIDNQLPSLASTEFACLTASTDYDLANVWLAVRNPMFQKALRHRVTGTSGSHQRVRPDDVMTIDVPDYTRLAPDRSRAALALLNSSSRARHEIQRLQALRDALLPELMSGRIRVPEVREAIDEEVGDVEIQ